MKYLMLAMLVLTIARPTFALDLGEAIPAAAVKMKNVDGQELTIADVKGAKGTLVIFSCNHCPFVIAWEERIAALGNAAAEQGVGVIQVNSNDPAKAGDTYAAMQERAKERGFEFPYVVDATSGVARAFGATRTPEAFLFNAKNELVYHGTIDDNYKQPEKVTATYLKDAIAALAAGQEIVAKETKAVGCGIKFRPEI